MSAISKLLLWRSDLLEKRIPLLGFCRGMQSILDYFGCRLENIDGHAATRHLINEEHNSYEVNSYHNQACRRLEENCELYTTAISEDGTASSENNLIMWFPVQWRNCRCFWNIAFRL